MDLNMTSERKIQLSVTNFLYHKDEFLFLKRNDSKQVDPGRMNGVGGKVEMGENYLDAAIRETLEETGYSVAPEDIELAGVVKLEGGYEVDWAMCFFKIKVPSKDIPKGSKTEDGELIWLHKDKVLDSEYKLVDDLTYCFKDIVEGNSIFFMTAKLNDSQKIYETSISKLPKAK
jgi:8-oxo-dGTP diphosphatase